MNAFSDVYQEKYLKFTPNISAVLPKVWYDRTKYLQVLFNLTNSFIFLFLFYHLSHYMLLGAGINKYIFNQFKSLIKCQQTFNQV